MAELAPVLADGRPLQPLADVQLPEIILKRRQQRKISHASQKLLGNVVESAVPLPPDDEAATSAVAAAVQAVAEQRPNIFAAVLQQSSKLDATGMFDPAVNKLRAAVTLQLKAYKQLLAQTPSLTATQAASAGAAAATQTAASGQKHGGGKDSVAARLEQMYTKVNQSLELERAAALAAAEAAAKRAQRANLKIQRKQPQHRASTVALAAAAAAADSFEAGNLSNTVIQTMGSCHGSMALDSVFPASNASGSLTTTFTTTAASSSYKPPLAGLTLPTSAFQNRSVFGTAAHSPPSPTGTTPRKAAAAAGLQRQISPSRTSSLLQPAGSGILPPVLVAGGPGRNSLLREDAPPLQPNPASNSPRYTRQSPHKQDLRSSLLSNGAAWLDKSAVVSQQQAAKVQMLQSAVEVLKEHLDENAFEAWQTEVATSREKQLVQYRATIQAAQQQLMQQQLDEEAALAAEQRALMGKVALAKKTEVDAAALTMKQLVHWLVNKDVPEPEPMSLLLEAQEARTSISGSAGGEDMSSTAAEAASQRLTQARTVREMMAAAQHHIQMRQQALHAWQQSVSYSTMAQQQQQRTSNCGSTTWGGTPAVSHEPSTQEAASAEPSGAAAAAGGPAQDPAAASSSTNTAVAGRAAGAAGSSDGGPGVAGASRSSGGAVLRASISMAASSSISSREAAAAPAAAGPAAASTSGAADVAKAAAGTTGAAGAGPPGRRVAFGARVSKAMADGGWKLAGPQLQVPTREEVEVVPLPVLPPLVDLCQEPAKVLQARLVRVWGILGVAPPQQMSMVLRYTARDKVQQFEPVLAAYEAAAAAVLQREALLQQLVKVKQAMDSCAAGAGSERPATQQQPTAWPMAGRGSKAGGRTTAEDLGMSVAEIQQLFWAFLVATKQVSAMATQLKEVSSEALLVGGNPYPGPEAIAEPQLLALLQRAHQLLQQ